jgi:ABC-type sugar transport system permease subunit
VNTSISTISAVTHADSSGAATIQPKHKRKRKYRKESFYEFLCTVPALFLIILLNHYPLLELVRYSFTDWNMLKKNYQYVGLTNWKWLFTTLDTNHVLDSFKITILYTVVHLMVIICLGLLFALLFNRMTKLFGFMRSVIFMPHYISMSSVAIVFIWLCNENYGVFNYLLGKIGIDPIAWLSSSSIAIWTIAYCWA